MKYFLIIDFDNNSVHSIKNQLLVVPIGILFLTILFVF